jgi:hypothetical protein
VYVKVVVLSFVTVLVITIGNHAPMASELNVESVSSIVTFDDVLLGQDVEN